MTAARCEGCGEHSLLLPLHGPKGGPLRCPLCVGQWNAEHGRRHRLGRIVVRAIKAYLDDGGKIQEIDKLKDAAFLGDWGFDPTGYIGKVADNEIVDLTTELLTNALKLTHPDHHPPERQELAHRTTQGLLALVPFVFPAPQPKPKPKLSDHAPDDKLQKAVKEVAENRRKFPCADCSTTVPYFYCDACRAEWEKRRAKEREQEAAEQRKWYARRRERKLARTPPPTCAACGTKFKGKRTDARFCSDACRQRAHRKAVTDKSSPPCRHLKSRDGGPAKLTRAAP